MSDLLIFVFNLVNMLSFVAFYIYMLLFIISTIVKDPNPTFDFIKIKQFSKCSVIVFFVCLCIKWLVVLCLYFIK